MPWGLLGIAKVEKTLRETTIAGAIFLKPGVVLDICSQVFWNQQRYAQLPWGQPTLDVFAGPLLEEHVTEQFSGVQGQFYTRHWCADSLGADAFMHPWDVRHPSGCYQMAWIYPPQDLIPRALMQLISKPVHATLILPSKVAVWTALLNRLPVVAKREVLPRQGGYILGAGAPPDWTEDKPLHLIAWRVWPGLDHCVHASPRSGGDCKVGTQCPGFAWSSVASGS